MKGLILSGGKGTRLRPLTFTRAKQLIPIANKPNLFYVVEDLLQAGIDDIGIIVSPQTGGEIADALNHAGEKQFARAKFTFIEQDNPLGLAHAVKTARNFLADEPFVMYLGDNLLSGGIVHVVDLYRSGGADSIILLTPVDNPQQFGVAQLDGGGKVIRLIEKPKDPPSNLALVGVYLFNPKIHDAIDALKPSSRGEYEITDAIQGLIDRGLTVKTEQVRGWWKDTGRPEDLLDANRQILSQIAHDVRGQLEGNKTSGTLVVEAGAKISNSTLTGPMHVAAGAVIESSHIGPYTSIGPDVKIINSRVEYSIILRETVLSNLPNPLKGGVIGQGVTVDGCDKTKSMTLILGDYSQVKL